MPSRRLARSLVREGGVLNLTDEKPEFDDVSYDDDLVYCELLALFNSALLLKLASILRSCVTMYFHTTFSPMK